MYKEKWYCSIWFIAVMFFMAVALSSETSETSTPKNDTVATTSPPEKHLEATTQTNTPESEKSTSFESIGLGLAIASLTATSEISL